MSERWSIAVLVGGLGVCGAACLLAPGTFAITAGVAIAGVAQAVAPNIAADIFSRIADWCGAKLRDKGATAQKHDLRELMAISIENVLDDVIKQEPGGASGVKLLKSYRAAVRDRLELAALDARFKGTWEQSVPTFFKARLEDFATVKALTPGLWEHFLNEVAYQSLDADETLAFKAAADSLYHALPKHLVGVYRDALQHHPRIFVAVQMAILQEIWNATSRVESVVESLRTEQKSVLDKLDALKTAIRAQFPAEFPEAVNELRVLGWTVEWLLRETHQEVLRISSIVDRIADSLPQKPTAQQVYSESFALAEAENFEQAAVKAEEARVLAEEESGARLRWKAGVAAARHWFNHGITSQLSDVAREHLATCIAKNIKVAEGAGAPPGDIALAHALLATYRRDNSEAVKFTATVIADPTSDEDTRADAIALHLQALLLSERLDDALAYYDVLEKLRGAKDGEQLLLIEATWLKILCESQLATEHDVSHFITTIERHKDVSPKVRLHEIDMVARCFSNAAQDPFKPISGALLVERLSKLKRLSSEFVGQLDQLVNAFAAQGSTAGAEEGLHELRSSLDNLLESVRPNTGDRHDQTIRLLEAGYAIVKPSAEGVTLTNLASQIAEMASFRGDTAKTERFLGYCDSWVEASKDSPSEEGRSPWFSLRAKALAAKGRTLYRLGCRLLRDGLPAERFLLGAEETLLAAHAFGTEHRGLLHGDAELFLADTSFWLGETAVILGLNATAAQRFKQTRSPAAMAHNGFCQRIGMLA
ncbi:MAG TPA: hypothetical protein VGG19_04390 [Tepidisphaeraceae bacterium]|jgi:hypothetical protein